MTIHEEHPYVKLARETIEEYICSGEIKEIKDALPQDMKKRRGVFVSIKKGGQLRGCIGTVKAVADNLAEEIIRNAISAATGDPRFEPVRPEELDELEISVDVLGEAEEVNSKEELDPLKYGVIVESGYQRGLLLPDLEGLDTVEKQLDIARRKAGIPQGAEYKIYRFKVERYR
ncbi:MAG TPA: AmmeMemoRadiSam system protein A [Halanaerobiales bacterium]|nr:AmmeMemoRadiSam system protein A [Halanaerobiales bacterium]